MLLIASHSKRLTGCDCPLLGDRGADFKKPTGLIIRLASNLVASTLYSFQISP